MASVRILSNGDPAETEIWVDGQKRDDVRAVSWRLDGNDRAGPEVQLTLWATDLEIELNDIEVVEQEDPDYRGLRLGDQAVESRMYFVEEEAS